MQYQKDSLLYYLLKYSLI